MPTPPQPDPTPNGARNPFLDADPLDYDALTEPDGPTSKPTPQRLRGRGRVVAVDSPSPIDAATYRSASAARFTRLNAGIDRLRVTAMGSARAAAVLAGRLLAPVVARPYAALTALSALAGLLIALGWFGLQLENASAARRAAEQRFAAATTTLNHDRARIDLLAAQLSEAALTARRKQTTETAAQARRPQAPQRKPARDRHRRH